ncbi:unnamed protein product [Symbiodinium necroappetens]|uniref:Ankyrin repeat domain-containing protein 50 n=1 Tax=Symbiodinium necroappetens TaxID=1628268 RepID=A0A812KKY4_9DINO|nr:unnamed protein product [Symbiodinium necroappetens]
MLRITLLSGEALASIAAEEVGDVKALKRRLHQHHGLPPRFRQKLLHEGSVLEDAAMLDSMMEVQVAAETSSEASGKKQRQLPAPAAEYTATGEVSLKRRLDTEDGLPPPCRQRKSLNDSYTPASVDLQLLILSFPEATSEEQRKVLYEAVVGGSPAEVEAVLQLPVDPDTIIEAGARTDLWGLGGRTALMDAAQGGHDPVVQLLLEVSLRDSCDSTALMEASSHGHAEVVGLLLEAGAHRDSQDSDGSTALMHAAYGGHFQVVQLLLEAGAQKDLHDNQGITALMDAARCGKTDIMKLLLQAGAQRDLKDDAGRGSEGFARP